MKPRLLKRIKAWEESGTASASDVDVNDMIESLRDDLEKLFNTRRGTVLVDEEYGLPDFTHLMNGYSAPDVSEIERSLLQQIRQYETRISETSLAYQDPTKGSMGLKFMLSAQFRHKGQQASLTSQLLLNDNGSISVSL
tara:strand:+ start:157 stop:573 length:417 start_codon:yes stop_codon:yes gene_type:complete